MKQLADVQRVGLQHLAAREGKQLAGQLGAAPRGAGGGCDQLLPVAIVGQCWQFFQHLQVALDHREQVVEVVGDAAGELADAFQALRMLQRILGLGALQAGGQQVGQRLEEAQLVGAEALRQARTHRQRADGAAAIGQRHRQHRLHAGGARSVAGTAKPLSRSSSGTATGRP